MRNPRFYEPQQLSEKTNITLSDDATQHIRVLRLNVGDTITLFNGEGGQYLAQLSEVQKRTCQADIISFQETNNESPLHLHLGQVISRGDRMEFVIQKAVELGERCLIRTGRVEPRLAPHAGLSDLVFDFLIFAVVCRGVPGFTKQVGPAMLCRVHW